MTKKNEKILILLVVFILFGSGCATNSISNKSVDESTDNLNLTSGSSLVLRQTVFGVGGRLVGLLGGKSLERNIEIIDWDLEKSLELKWFLEEEVQTAESEAEQKEYDLLLKNTPVGIKVVERPEKTYETFIQEGVLRSESMDNSETILLPASWSEGDTMNTSNHSIIWLSKKQYDELSKTKKTHINLGLFDNSVSSAIKMTDDIKNLINKLQKNSEEASEAEDILEVNASEDFGAYSLLVNGKKTTVKTIQAQNWFGRYTILANKNNPVILEVILSPVSKGSLNIFSKENLLQSFLGYEITEINSIQTSSSSADQSQP
jgi:hypothetical protein